MKFIPINIFDHDLIHCRVFKMRETITLLVITILLFSFKLKLHVYIVENLYSFLCYNQNVISS